MRRTHFLLGFIALLAFDTLGQVGFKLVANHTAPVEATPAFFARLPHEPWVLAVLIAYGGAFMTYMSLIKNAPVGPLFAASHLDIVTVAGISLFAFDERLTSVQVVGCIAILGGVLLLAAAEGEEEKS